MLNLPSVNSIVRNNFPSFFLTSLRSGSDTTYQEPLSVINKKMKTFRIKILLLVTIISCNNDVTFNSNEKKVVYFKDFKEIKQSANSKYDKVWELNHDNNNLTSVKIRIAKTTVDSTSNYILLTMKSSNDAFLDSLQLPNNIYESVIVTQTKENLEMQFIGNINSTVKSHSRIKIQNDGNLNNYKVKQERNSDSIFYQIPSIYAYEIIEDDSTKIVIEKSEGLEENTYSFTLNLITKIGCRIQLRHYNYKDSIIGIDEEYKNTFTIGKDYFKI